jgi:hypothetical protein
MELNEYLNIYFTQLSFTNICNDNDFATYENFKRFIDNHYSLEHMEKHNYLKYVKVKRQILKLNDNKLYLKYIDNINSHIKLLADMHAFPHIDIKKYMFKIHNIFKIIDEKKIALSKTIKIIRSLFDVKSASNITNIKLMMGLNTISYRYKLLLINSKKIIEGIHKLIELEGRYGIEHKLIQLNNMERSFLGKKSEYTANKVIQDYVNLMNLKLQEENKYNVHYYYETNVDLIKLFDIILNHTDTIKGEVDGIIIYYDGTNYIIDKIIEVKSSIKATFEDIKKFICLQEYIHLIDDNIEIKYNNYVFTKESFVNIKNNQLNKWVVYLCINNINQDFIEKSHLFFSTVLKIIDDEFIKDYYIDKNEYVLMNKYKIVDNNRKMIDTMFNSWIDNISFGTDDCIIFMTKK